MSFPAQDIYWNEAADFILKALGPDTPFIAPREFRSVLPRVFPYDFVHAIEILGEYGAVVVHKGLLQELPLTVLETVNREWKCVFANGVFLIYVSANSSLPAADQLHQGIFKESLESLKKLAEIEVSQVRELTAVVIVASHGPDVLRKSLQHMKALHAPILVVAESKDAKITKEYETICGEHDVQLLKEPRATTRQGALKEGIRFWLNRGDIAWICSFDDDILVRADFLLLMEGLRSRERRCVVVDHWTETDRTHTSFSRNGITCVVPIRQKFLHCYAHRDYWRRRFFPTLKLGQGAYRHWRSFLFPPTMETLVVLGLVTRQSGDEIID